MSPILIGTNSNPDTLIDRLNEKMEFLEKQGLPVNMGIDKIGDLTYLDCQIQQHEKLREEEAYEVIKKYIANCLAEIIIEEWENRLIGKIIRDHYFYYQEEEKEAILNKAREMLNPEESGLSLQKQRKERILTKLVDYLDLHRELILEGFINFRLKEYQEELEGIVNLAVDEFMLEKEYLEFVKLLKYFVDIQEPRIDKLKIVFTSKGNFNLLDKENKTFTHECLDGLMADLLDNQINYDDLLISALITLSPAELEIHTGKGRKPSDTITTIQRVFSQRVTMCDGCELCRSDKPD